MICLMPKLSKRPGCGWAYVIISILIVGLVAGAAVPGFAEEWPEILPLNPVPGMPGHWILSGEGPPINVRVGVLDHLGENAVVVDDSVIRFSTEQEVVFYARDSFSQISRSDFQIGDLVACELDADGRLMILWLFED